MADEQWIDVLPAMGNFNQRLVREATRSATQAGRRAGVGYSDAFEDAADGASDSAVSELEASEKRAAGLVSRLSGEVSKARQGMQRSAATQLTAEQRLADAVEKHGRESRQARAAELNLQAARGRAADATQRFENAEDGLREAQRSHTSITEDLAQAQQRAAESTDSASRSTGRMTGGLKGLIGRAKAATGGVGGLVTKMAAAAGGAKLLKDAFSQAMDKQNLTSNLEAQLGSTPKQAKRYGAAAASLYAKGYGENLDEVGTAVDGVVSSFKGLRNSSKKDIAAMTGYAMDLSKTFDVDLSESTTAASVMIKNGLAKNGTQAFDMMAGAMQKIPKGVRDEVLPTLTEYSKHYAQLGIDGNQAMMMIAAGAENGVIGVDKVGDAIKEFTIRGTDMSKSTTATYKALGLNTKQITNDLLAGGDKAKGAMGQVVTALQGVKDPGNKANMAISLFGTQLEDLGTENVPEFLKMINPATQETGKFAGTAKKMGDTLHSGAANGLETAKRSFQNMLSKGVAPLLGPVEKFTTWATKTPGVLQGLTIGLGAVAAAWLGVTLAASPWLAIAAGVGLAIAGIIVVIKNWGKIWNWLKNNVIGPFFNWLKPGFKAIGDWLKSVYESIIKPVFHAFAAIGKWLWLNILKPTFLAMRTGFKIIATVFLAQWVIIKALFKAFAAVGRWLWKNALKPAFGWIKAGFKALGTAIGIVYRAVIKPIFQAYAAIGRWLWTHALKPAFGWIKTGFRALGAGIGIVYRTLIKPIFKAAGVVGKWLWTNALKPAFNGIKAGWKGMTNGMKWVWDHVLHPVFKAVKKVIGSVADSFKIAKKAIKTAWDGLKKIAAAPVNFVIKWVYNKGIKPLWNGVTKVFGGKTLKKIDPIKYRTGGVTPGYTPGRDVHHYYSPTGGALDLSGGEAVMRPEFTRAVGSGWVNGINAAARTGGVAGVKSALGQGQAFKDGGLVKPLHGWQTDFHNFGESRAGGKHQGDDLAVGTGTPVYAVMDGKVAKTGWNIITGRTGKGVFLDHAGNHHSYYGHLSRSWVKPGQHVNAGQQIAWSGATGHVTGPHLHFEWWNGGNYYKSPVNPASILYGGSMPKGGDVFAGAGAGAAAEAPAQTAKQKKNEGWLAKLAGLGKKVAGGVGGFIKGIGKKFGAITSGFKDRIKSLADSPWIQSMTSGVKSLVAKPLKKIKSLGHRLWGKVVGEDMSGSATGGGVAGALKGGPVKDQVKSVAKKYGWNKGAQWKALDHLVQGESSWNPKAANSSSPARGLFQKMTDLHGPVEKTVAGQAKWGLKYIRDTYGTPANAYSKWLSRDPHWYKDGGILPTPAVYDQGGWMRPGQTGINLSGKPEPVFTAMQWRTLKAAVQQHDAATTREGDTYIVNANEAVSGQEVVDRLKYATLKARR